MKISKKIRIIFIGSILTSLFLSTAFAGGTCIECDKKNIHGLPNIDPKLLSVIDKTMPEVQKNIIMCKHSSFADCQDGLCRKYTQIIRNQLHSFIDELETTTPYSIDEFLQKPGCNQEGYNSDKVKSPMLHLTCEDPALREDFLQLFYKYYTVKRKDPSLWLAAINAKNTEGETALDYFEHQIRGNNYHVPESKNALANMIAFACSKGAVYSKYKDKKCP